MRTWLPVVLAALLVSCVVPCVRAQLLAPGGAATGAAQQLIDDMVAGDFTKAVGSFEQTLAATIPADKLGQTWKAIVGQVGPYQRSLSTKTGHAQGYDVAIVKCEFERAVLDVKVSVSADGHIGGLWITPSDRSGEYHPPDYINADAFRETEVKVGDGEWVLAGTLAMPVGDGPFPGVVLVQGSGPQDRDETIGPNKPFRDLAGGLASRGIAALRYEKRTKTYGAQIAQHQDGLTVKEETTDDALAAAALLRQTKGIDPARVFIVGHSLGAMLAPRIATADPKLAGIVVMAGPTRPLEDVATDQLDYIGTLKANMGAAEKQELDNLEAQLARVKDPNLEADAKPGELFFYAPASYWLDLRGYKPAAVAAGLSRPMLILQGGRDYQVTRADYAGWQQALGDHKNATLKFYDNVNHLFAEGQGMATPEEYGQPMHVSPVVIADIAAWIAAPPK